MIIFDGETFPESLTSTDSRGGLSTSTGFGVRLTSGVLGPVSFRLGGVGSVNCLLLDDPIFRGPGARTEMRRGSEQVFDHDPVQAIVVFRDARVSCGHVCLGLGQVVHGDAPLWPDFGLISKVSFCRWRHSRRCFHSRSTAKTTTTPIVASSFSSSSFSLSSPFSSASWPLSCLLRCWLPAPAPAWLFRSASVRSLRASTSFDPRPAFPSSWATYRSKRGPPEASVPKPVENRKKLILPQTPFSFANHFLIKAFVCSWSSGSNSHYLWTYSSWPHRSGSKITANKVNLKQLCFLLLLCKNCLNQIYCQANALSYFHQRAELHK